MSKVKVLLHYDEEAYKSNLNLIAKNKPKLDAVLVAYAALNFSPLTLEELPKLLDDTENFVIDKMINGQPLLLAGLPVRREKANDLIVKPEGYEALEAAIKEAAPLVKFGNCPIEHYDIVEGEFQLKEECALHMQEAYKKYATSQNQADAYTHFQQIATSLNELSKLGVWFGNGAHTHADTIADAVINVGPALQDKFEVRINYITGLQLEN